MSNHPEKGYLSLKLSVAGHVSSVNSQSSRSPNIPRFHPLFIQLWNLDCAVTLMHGGYASRKGEASGVIGGIV